MSKPAGDAVEIAYSIAIAVLEAAGIELIDHGAPPPWRCGYGRWRDWPGARHCNKVAKPVRPLQILRHERTRRAASPSTVCGPAGRYAASPHRQGRACRQAA